MAADICGCPGEQPTFTGTFHDVGMYSSMCSTEEIKSFSETRMSVKWITFHLGHLEGPLIIAIQVLFFPPKVQSMHLFPAWNPLNVECLVYIGCSANRRSMSEWLNRWIHALSVPPGQRSNTLACPARPWPADLAHLPGLILHPSHAPRAAPQASISWSLTMGYCTCWSSAGGAIFHCLPCMCLCKAQPFLPPQVCPWCIPADSNTSDLLLYRSCYYRALPFPVSALDSTTERTEG